MNIQLGDTGFNSKAGETMTFAEFKKHYSMRNLGITLEEAYVKLGGKIRKTKKPKEE